MTNLTGTGSQAGSRPATRPCLSSTETNMANTDHRPVYRILRFSMTEPREEIRDGLTLEEAQEHCGREDTHGPGWFDGYDLMAGFSDEDEDAS